MLKTQKPILVHEAVRPDRFDSSLADQPRDAPTAAPVGDQPVLRLLGRIELTGVDWQLTSQQLSLIAFLACCGPADRGAIIEGLWDGRAVSRGRFPNLLAELRARIGRRHLPEALDGRYRLAGIDTDLEYFEAAVVAASAAAAGANGLAVASQGPAPGARGAAETATTAADRRLQRALDLVQGVPLTATGRRYWSWVGDRGDIAVGIECLVSDAALQLAARCRDRGDLTGAVHACRQGLLACPLDENLVTELAALHIEFGRFGAARLLVDGWESKVQRLGCGRPPEGPRARLRARAMRTP